MQFYSSNGDETFEAVKELCFNKTDYVLALLQWSFFMPLTVVQLCCRMALKLTSRCIGLCCSYHLCLHYIPRDFILKCEQTCLVCCIILSVNKWRMQSTVFSVRKSVKNGTREILFWLQVNTHLHREKLEWRRKEGSRTISDAFFSCFFFFFPSSLFCGGRLQESWVASNTAQSKSRKFRVMGTTWCMCRLFALYWVCFVKLS